MDGTTEDSMRAVIAMLNEKFSEEITVDDMARVAMFSKFHFTRLFQRVTGISPGRFLSCIRMQKAKRLLLSSSLNVTDICSAVGYSAVGTFSTRFKGAVGLAPLHYRLNGGLRPRVPSPVERHGSVIRGSVAPCPDAEHDPIFVGLFSGPVPEGLPACSTVLSRAGAFELDQVPPGRWHVLGLSLPRTQGMLPGTARESEDQPAAIAVAGPVVSQPNTPVHVDLRLRPMRQLDPPILPALLDRASARSAGLIDG